MPAAGRLLRDREEAGPRQVGDPWLSFEANPAAVTTQVRALTGLTVLAYLRTCRLDWAASALAHTDAPVKQVTAECGLQCVQGFSRAFRRRHGCSPGRYRRQPEAARGRAPLRRKRFTSRRFRFTFGDCGCQ
ncbi:MAG: helix-turn-helix transcriptional regulator [Candidatus Latescibacterota bacterium]